jgi:hypothetical protein
MLKKKKISIVDELSAYLKNLPEEQRDEHIALMAIAMFEKELDSLDKNTAENKEGLEQLRRLQIEARDKRRPQWKRNLKWQMWKNEKKLSYGQIVKRHKTETGEEVNVDTVRKALKRLK